MHKVLERYFALQEAIRKGISSKEKSLSDVNDIPCYGCITCDAKEGWEDKLTTILQEHGVAVEKFSYEYFSYIGYHGSPFRVHEGKLRLVNNARCIAMDTVLKVAAGLLPED